MNRPSNTLTIEYFYLGLLALLWGSSYPLIKIAVAEIPPITLIAARVTIAALFLSVVGVTLIVGVVAINFPSRSKKIT